MPDEPEADRKDVQSLCPECGELLEVNDIAAFVLAIHIRESCASTENLFGR